MQDDLGLAEKMDIEDPRGLRAQVCRSWRNEVVERVRAHQGQVQSLHRATLLTRCQHGAKSERSTRRARREQLAPSATGWLQVASSRVPTPRVHHHKALRRRRKRFEADQGQVQCSQVAMLRQQ